MVYNPPYDKHGAAHLEAHHPVNLGHTAVDDLLASAMATMASVTNVIVDVLKSFPIT